MSLENQVIDKINIEYILTNDIHSFFNYYDDYDAWDITRKEIAKNFKYGNCVFDTGYNDHIYFLAIYKNQLVGILKFKVGGSDSYKNPGFCNWICFIEVHKDYRNMGISTHLKEMLFQYCSQCNMNILSSGFTLLGHMYNLKGYIELAKKYGVEYSYEQGVRHPNFTNFEGMNEKEYMAYYELHKPDFDCYENIIINEKRK